MSSRSLQTPNSNNPFEDSAASETSVEIDSVLAVGRNATLTLGTDSLILVDESLKTKGAADSCCRIFWAKSKTTQSIHYHDILWAKLTDFEITVHYADPTGSGNKGRRVRYLHYDLSDQKQEQAHRWVEKLMKRAYPPSVQRRKRIKVLVNPFGGQGNAQKIWSREVEPIFAAALCDIDVETTTHQGHAVEICQNLDIDAYDVVACASGDGLPHEAFNGLAKHKQARRALRQVAVCQLPCGTGNAMCLNLNGTDSPSLAALEIVKGRPTSLDLIAITQGSNKYYSFLSQAVGIVAETDLGTESLRWMGAMRFTWGCLVRILGKTQYPAELSVVVESEDKHAIRETYRHAVEEHEASLTKDLPPTSNKPVGDGSDTSIPPLRFGTVLDPLPSAFTTQDLPNLGNFYAGNMCYMTADAPFFTTALPSDGKLDLVTISGDIPRWTAVSMLVEVASGTFMNFPEVHYRKLWAYRITPRRAPSQLQPSLRTRIGKWLSGASNQTEGLIAIDGERVPFEPFQAEVVPGLGTVLSKRGAVYEWHGAK